MKLPSAKTGTWKIAVILTAAILIVASAAIFLSSSSPAKSSKPQVVTSFYPLYFFATEIAGNRSDVHLLIPDNSEPHSWEPKPSDLMTISNTRLFIYNGGGFEPWVDDFLAAIESNNVAVIDTSKNISQITTSKGVEDPHFWLDPISAKKQVDNILDGFKKADIDNSSYYEQRAKDLKDRLDDLNSRYMTGLNNRTKNAIITTHEGFGYLAYRYGFQAYGALGISADAQPSAKGLANLTKLVTNLGLHYVFSEPVYSDAVIDTIARETGTQVLVLDGIHGRTGVHANMDYFQIMNANLESLRIGLEVSS